MCSFKHRHTHTHYGIGAKVVYWTESHSTSMMIFNTKINTNESKSSLFTIPNMWLIIRISKTKRNETFDFHEICTVYQFCSWSHSNVWIPIMEIIIIQTNTLVHAMWRCKFSTRKTSFVRAFEHRKFQCHICLTMWKVVPIRPLTLFEKTKLNCIVIVVFYSEQN